VVSAGGAILILNLKKLNPRIGRQAFGGRIHLCVMDDTLFDSQVPGQDKRKILLHTCCAPCSCSILKRLVDLAWEPAVYFYNPNIYPREEYEKRKREVIRYAEKLGAAFVDEDSGRDSWFETVKGHEEDPERGERCGLCFDMRLGKSAAYASENGFRVFTSSLGISRWKDFDQVTRSGEKAASLFPGLVYWGMNWRKDGGSAMAAAITKEESFYRQNYCGCLYSLKSRKKKDLPAINTGRSE